MKLSIVIPCYNESEIISEAVATVCALLNNLIEQDQISADSQLYLIDDGSNDNSWDLIKKISETNDTVSGIKLSRNMGHQNALLAGLLTVDGDAVISMDADLQDDPNAIPQFLEQLDKGADIVYGVRNDRSSDSTIKRCSAELFYSTLNFFGAGVIFNHGDYRALSRRAIEELRQFSEVNLYLRGMIPLLGLKYSIVEYRRLERIGGSSKYGISKMLGLALNAVTSFSVVPLRIITYLGFLVFIVSMTISIWALWIRLFTSNAIPGWTSSVLPIYFLGGIQILCIGVLGEYLGKIYQEVKARPRFIIEEKTRHSE